MTYFSATLIVVVLLGWIFTETSHAHSYGSVGITISIDLAAFSTVS
jgi:hypothetical protein